MTVNTTDITDGPYAGNDIADAFAYSFRVGVKTDLAVYNTDAAGVITTLTVDVDYTVNNVGTDAGGTVTRIAGALPTGVTWYIRANYPDTQLTAFASQGGFFPAVHEAAFDKLTFLYQQMLDIGNRALRFADSYSGGASTTLPDPVADNFLKVNAAGDGFVFTSSSAGGLGSPGPIGDGTPGTGDFSEIGANSQGPVTGTLLTATTQIRQSKGADVASATALPILAGGNYFDVTGSVTITSINTTGRVGTLIKLHFDGALILTNHATNLILPGGANVTTAAGDEFEFIEYAAGDFRCTGYTLASGRAITFDTPVGHHEIVMTGAAGHGSTNTTIRVLSTELVDVGTAIVRASTSALGDSFTIAAGHSALYGISYTDGTNSSNHGISINSSQLTTSIAAITNANRVGSVFHPANESSNFSTVVYLPAGTVVRPHTDGVPSATSNSAVMFRIIKLSVIT